MDATQRQAPSREADREALVALNGVWLDSYIARDAEALGKIMADDFLAIYGSGERHGKAEALARLSAMTEEPLSLHTENLAVHVAGDVAVVTARATAQIRNGDRVDEECNEYADIYARRDGRWQAVSAHIVAVTP